MKIDIGCGEWCEPGWESVDIRPGPGIKHVADMRSMPFKNGEIEAIRCVQALEHINLWDTATVLLEFWRVLKPYGIAYIAVPDFTKIVQLFIEEKDYATKWGARLMQIFGMSTPPPQEHHNGFDLKRLSNMLNACGFKVIDTAEYIDDWSPSFWVNAQKTHVPLSNESIMGSCTPVAFLTDNDVMKRVIEAAPMAKTVGGDLSNGYGATLPKEE